MTTAPLEAPIELFDIELEELLDGSVVCISHTDRPAVALVHHVHCTEPAWFVCDSCVERLRRWVKFAISSGWLLDCDGCGTRNIPPADIIIRPI